MPTGYTATLMEKGQTFPEFAMLCARAFGATIMLREEPLDKPIPVFEPSNYNAKEAKKERETLAILQAMNAADIQKYGKKKKARELGQHREWLEKARAEDAKLDAMAEQVRAWKPPTPDHEGMKQFMLEQIATSRNGEEYHVKAIAAIEGKSPESYWAEAVEAARRGIEYHEKAQREEIERTNGRNEWVKALRDSLKP